MNQNDLRVDFCSYAAAKYACLHWHYSKSVPAGKIVKIGVWENNKFIGSVLFSRGANRHIAKPYKLKDKEVCELTRVALSNHQNPVSKILSLAIKLFKTHNPGIKLIVSYADANQDHLGIIYQATNWIYEGKFANETGVKLNGKIIHRRTINSKYNTSDLNWLRKNIDPKAEVIKGKFKFKYLMALDKATKKRLNYLNKPFPKKLE